MTSGLATAIPASAQPVTPTTSPTTVAASDPTTTGGVSSGRAEATVDVLRADADEVRAELAATASRRSEAQARLATVRAEAAASAAAAAEAETAERAAAAEARRLDTEVKAAAVDAFIGSGHHVPMGILATDDVQDASWGATVLKYQAEELDALLGEQEDAHRHLDAERRSRVAAAADADAAQQRAMAEVDGLVRLEADQAALVAQVDDRLDAALSEAAALAAIDAEAAAGLAAKEQELATTAALSVSAPPQAAPEGTRTAARAPTTTTPSTIPPGPSAPATTAPPPTTAPPGPVQPPAPVDTVNVRGFVVARSIADQLTRLLDAAQGAGLVFGGSGYRDVNVQIGLRRQHCGTTDYDIWQKPANQCSPPTAIPGRSMHEKGLAIDFTCAGVLIRDRASPCFGWLAANAASYGFYNLPSEPWHWSTNGN